MISYKRCYLGGAKASTSSKIKKAFTLVETLVVMAIISMMIGLLAPKGQKFLDSMNNVMQKHKETNIVKYAKLNAFFQDKLDANLSIFKPMDENE